MSAAAGIGLLLAVLGAGVGGALVQEARERRRRTEALRRSAIAGTAACSRCGHQKREHVEDGWVFDLWDGTRCWLRGCECKGFEP